jgi:ABC-type cobalamin/Fe3+-siderophores transport system ATPase subunit
VPAGLTCQSRSLNNPVFQYCTNKDTSEYIEFNDASAGQQATALLTVLLNQPGAPLVIDQPEDDVDSKMSPEIGRQIWNAKSRRQLIFASHNANFVVNGDSELVVCCDYVKAGDQTGGQIKDAGAIDDVDQEGNHNCYGRRRAGVQASDGKIRILSLPILSDPLRTVTRTLSGTSTYEWT